MITPRQHAYATDLAKRLHLPRRMLDDFCVQRFGRPLDELSKQEASRLLDEMVSWEQLPAELERAKGQLDLIGFEGLR